MGVAAFQSMQALGATSSSGPQTTPPPADCAPTPCAHIRGYSLWISNLTVAGDLVSMQVTFKNASNSTHADPADLQLVESRNNIRSAIFDGPGCTKWSRTEFNNGRMLGPLTLCFRTAASSHPLTLRWSPDFGLFCCRSDIKLD